MLISYFIMLISMLVGVGFFVLLERKILSGIHFREGPEKVCFLGLLQPFCDGGKLFSKGYNSPLKSDFMIFFISPILSLMLCFLSWMLYLYSFDIMDMVLGLLLLLCLSSMNAYVSILSGWSSNSIYSMIGSYRGVAQSISYEVTMFLLLIGSVSVVKNYNLMDFLSEKGLYGVCYFSMFVWFSVIIAETNRSPYDFVEGESELVSGFNVEYSSIGFSVLFLGEYGMMLFMSYITGVMFWGEKYGSMTSIFCMGFIWIRGILPRFRYDKLMMMTWKYYLYYSLCSLIFFLGYSSFSMNMFKYFH